MRRKGIALLLLLAALTLLPACRRRLDPNGQDRIRETVSQPEPGPIQGTGQQIRDPALEPDPEQIQQKRDPQGSVVDETTPARGGETVPRGPEAPEPGDTLTVTLDPMGGDCNVTTLRVRAGEVYGVLPVPSREGWTFQGWFREPEGGEPLNEVSLVLTDTDHTIYAHWSETREFTLTFDPNGGRISPYSAEKKIYPGELYGQLPEPIRSGYRFLGWFTEPEGGIQVLAEDSVTTGEDQTLYAQWEYSPLDYWTFVLKNAKERLYTCQEVSAYLELETPGATLAQCGLLTDAGVGNIGEKQEEPSVSDDWVMGKKPDLIVKIIEDMASAQAVKTSLEQRFPGKTVAVMSMAALEGSPEEQLYGRLRLAALCYPELFAGVDLDAAGAELGVSETLLFSE